ncbi:hypothetical protein [uncultured Phascolarctobacterium sp.]
MDTGFRKIGFNCWYYL